MEVLRGLWEGRKDGGIEKVVEGRKDGGIERVVRGEEEWRY